VDDCQVSQKLHQHVIGSDNQFEIIGIASNGREAIELSRTHKPHVISMDLNMPVMDGMEATRQIMRTNPVPIVVVSSLYDPDKLELAMEVLEAGAVITMPKPFGPGHPEHERTAKKYRMMLKSMAEVRVIRRRPHLFNKKSSIENSPVTINPTQQETDYRVVLIGASAGGPESTKTILSALNEDFPLPIMIVQHIDRNFTESYRSWLQSHSNVPLLTAADDQPLLPGHAYLAPADKHLIVKSEGLAGLSNDPPVRGGQRPSVARLFKSAGEIYGKKVIAVILSGMGKDGVAEMKMLRDMGAYTIAQDENSSLVYGMPGEAVRIGAAENTYTPEEMVKLIININRK